MNPGVPCLGPPRPELVAPTNLAGVILEALPDPILLIGGDNGICFANPAAEHFFAVGVSVLLSENIAALVPDDSPLLDLLAQVRRSGQSLSEYGLDLSTPRAGPHYVDVRLTRMNLDGMGDGVIVLSLIDRGIARKIGDQLLSRGAARSVSGMAAVLAHEIKNPLSGVRGAAQLIERNAAPADRRLTRLICEETDRICALVDRMEVFSERRALRQAPVNIHEVLDHVRRLAEAGFGRKVRFMDRYDPSLPSVAGDRGQLIQVFLNLIKNAVEAAPRERGEVTLATAFRHGVRVKAPGSGRAMSLPIEIRISDNGPGVPEDLQPHLFEAFVSTKAGGTGLGLALVAKLVGDHGGIVECMAHAGRGCFRVLLPAIDQTPAIGDPGPTP